MEKKYTIYCDLDGVLVDFIKGYLELTGRDITGQFLNSKWFWEPIDRAGKKFWSDLEWTHDGKHLWNHIEKHNPKILSAPSRENDSIIGKHDWVKREIPGSQLLLRSPQNKKEFATPTSILIDDRLDNIEGWVNSSGIGILHKNAVHTIKQLKELGI
jgi:hypothetical protein